MNATKVRCMNIDTRQPDTPRLPLSLPLSREHQITAPRRDWQSISLADFCALSPEEKRAVLSTAATIAELLRLANPQANFSEVLGKDAQQWRMLYALAHEDRALDDLIPRLNVIIGKGIDEEMKSMRHETAQRALDESISPTRSSAELSEVAALRYQLSRTLNDHDIRVQKSTGNVNLAGIMLVTAIDTGRAITREMLEQFQQVDETDDRKYRKSMHHGLYWKSTLQAILRSCDHPERAKLIFDFALEDHRKNYSSQDLRTPEEGTVMVTLGLIKAGKADLVKEIVDEPLIQAYMDCWGDKEKQTLLAQVKKQLADKFDYIEIESLMSTWVNDINSQEDDLRAGIKRMELIQLASPNITKFMLNLKAAKAINPWTFAFGEIEKVRALHQFLTEFFENPGKMESAAKMLQTKFSKTAVGDGDSDWSFYLKREQPILALPPQGLGEHHDERLQIMRSLGMTFLKDPE